MTTPITEERLTEIEARARSGIPYPFGGVTVLELTAAIRAQDEDALKDAAALAAVRAQHRRDQERIAMLVRALVVCDRVLHFDLRRMIGWGSDFNQAVKDAADAARAALANEKGESDGN